MFRYYQCDRGDCTHCTALLRICLKVVIDISLPWLRHPPLSSSSSFRSSSPCFLIITPPVTVVCFLVLVYHFLWQYLGVFISEKPLNLGSFNTSNVTCYCFLIFQENIGYVSLLSRLVIFYILYQKSIFVRFYDTIRPI